MLQTLCVQNYALIDQLEIELSEGFNVLTGETGAGKSILVGALNLILGARASADMVRTGAKRAKVDAVFRIAEPSNRLIEILDAYDIELDGDELLISRVVTREGRSKAYAGGSLIPASALARIGDELVDLHGQHEHQSLLKPDRQLLLLDGFAGHIETASTLAQAVRVLRSLEKEIESIESVDREQERRIDFLRFEVQEINKARLVENEDTELTARRNLLTNSEQIVTLATQTLAELSDSENFTPAADLIGTAQRNVDEMAAVDPRFEPLRGQLESITSELESIATELRAYSEGVEFEVGELDALNARLSLIAELKRKYGATLEAIVQYRDEAQAKIERYQNRDERLAELRAQREVKHATVLKQAKELSSKRKKAAKKLKRRITSALHELGMEGGSFDVSIADAPLSSRGVDAVEFLLAANAGDEAKALRQVASGGEVSRIMLAMKSVFAKADCIPTLIFDEIDAGVGGTTAHKVAAKMRQLATSHQTICITHLPQLAACADTHFHVSKVLKNGRTVTTVRRVEEDFRVEEVARLLDGSLSEESLAHARSLLDRAG